MSLTLEHTDPIVQLLQYRILLVTCCIVLACEGRVVSGDFCDVGVLPPAEFGVVVA
jgi:hypothetical protein